MRLLSWNVNGVRAIAGKGFLEWLDEASPDVLCIQEIKAHAEAVPPEVRAPKGYGSVWRPAKRPGYSGVAAFFKKGMEPLDVRELGIEEFDLEGRVQILEYAEFHLINAYFPNSQPERARLDYKLRFCKAMLELCEGLRSAGKHVVLCGDYNIAHTEIDLARPKENRDNPGFYPEECASMDAFLHTGYVDVFRKLHPGEPGHYTWWSYRMKAREKNVGWRLDYHCVNEEFAPRVKNAVILSNIMGSDHCPVALQIK